MNRSIRYLSVPALFTFLALNPTEIRAGSEGMPSMPLIQPKKTFTVKDGSELESQRGFGDQEPEVKMMNLMMVEGSGMEGMSMSAMGDMKNTKMDAGKPAQSDEAKRMNMGKYAVEIKAANEPARVGATLINITVKDRQNKQPVKGLKLKAKVYMTQMDMGTDAPLVSEVSKGQYQLKAPFAMKGQWAVKVELPDGESQITNFDVSLKK
jgi:hypothetical protein